MPASWSAMFANWDVTDFRDFGGIYATYATCLAAELNANTFVLNYLGTLAFTYGDAYVFRALVPNCSRGTSPVYKPMINIFVCVADAIVGGFQYELLFRLADYNATTYPSGPPIGYTTYEHPTGFVLGYPVAREFAMGTSLAPYNCAAYDETITHYADATIRIVSN